MDIVDKLKSQIEGKANIIFGGKIGGAITKFKTDEPNIILRIGELSKEKSIGEPTKDNDYEKDFQVNMIFNNIESIKIVKKWLDIAEEKLQNQLEGKKWDE